MKLTKEVYGANIIVGIRGDSKEEVEMAFNGIYNYNGCPTLTELDWIVEQEAGFIENEDGSKSPIKANFFAIFQTDEKRLQRSFRDQAIVDLTYPKAIGNGREIKQMAEEHAAQVIADIERDATLLADGIRFVVPGH